MSDKVKRTASRDSSSILTQLSTISRETSNQPLNSSETQFPLGVSGSALQDYQCLRPPFHTASQETTNHPPVSLLFTSAAQENDLVYAHHDIRIV